MKAFLQVYAILFFASTGSLFAQVTTNPTNRPTRKPTSKPTCAPVTPKPSRSPTAKPTKNPTSRGTSKPTKRRKKRKSVSRKSAKCQKSSKKSSKRPSIKKTKSPAYAGIGMKASSVVSVATCTDGADTYADNWGVKRSCAWLDYPWKLNKNCGTSTDPITALGKNCKYACRSYNSCSCTDATGSFLTHVKNLQPCSWLDGSPWKMLNNCGNSTTPPTQIGMKCRASCKDYNDCGLDYYYYYYTSRRG